MITLIEAKLHLRVDTDEDDFGIHDMIEASKQHLTSIGCDLNADPMPAPLKQAALMLIADFYENRGLTWGSEAKYSPVFLRLVAPYREVAL